MQLRIQKKDRLESFSKEHSGMETIHTIRLEGFQRNISGSIGDAMRCSAQENNSI